MSAEQIKTILNNHSGNINVDNPIDLSEFVFSKELWEKVKDYGFEKIDEIPEKGETVFFLPQINIPVGFEMVNGAARAIYREGRPRMIHFMGEANKGAEKVLDFEYAVEKDYLHPLSKYSFPVIKTIVKGWNCKPNGKKVDRIGATINFGFFGDFISDKVARQHTTLSLSIYGQPEEALQNKHTKGFIETARAYSVSDHQNVVYISQLDSNRRGFLKLTDGQSRVPEELLKLFPEEIDSVTTYSY